MPSISRPSTSVYSQISKRSALLSLLAYALQPQHRHSHLWIGALTLLLQREGDQHA